MKNNRWHYGLGLFIALGLTSCSMDSGQSEPMASYDTGMTAQKATSTPKQTSKASVTKDAVQKSTPGPKRAAAPQIPVIQ